MSADAAPAFDVLDVLTSSGEARDELRGLLPGNALEEFDAQLVAEVARRTGRVGATLQTRHALVELCGIVRAVDAANRGRIELGELREGLAVHAERTEGFRDFHDARVLVRTLGEVLAGGRDQHASAATGRQVELLGRELRDWLLQELTGSPDGVIRDTAPTTSRGERWPDLELEAPGRRQAHGLVDDLFHGADHHPVTGLLGAAWVRGWSAVPLPGERIAELQPDITMLQAAIAGLAAASPVLVERRVPPPWRLEGGRVVLQPALRRAWSVPDDERGASMLVDDARGRCVLTTSDLQFALVEGVEHVAMLGPATFVERACGMAPLEVVARFREHVEALADDDGDPPDHLLEVATSFGRLRRRSR